MEIREIVLKAFADSKKALKSAEISEITWIDKKEVDKAIKQLKAEEKIYSPKVCFYEIKK